MTSRHQHALGFIYQADINGYRFIRDLWKNECEKHFLRDKLDTHVCSFGKWSPLCRGVIEGVDTTQTKGVISRNLRKRFGIIVGSQVETGEDSIIFSFSYNSYQFFKEFELFNFFFLRELRLLFPMI